jgi:hypothetical protein
MALLPTPLAATAFAPLGRLKTRAVAGGRFGRVAGVTADPLAQVGQFCRQGGELGRGAARSPGAAPESPAVAAGSDRGHWSAKPTSPRLKSRQEGRSSRAVSA